MTGKTHEAKRQKDHNGIFYVVRQFLHSEIDKDGVSEAVIEIRSLCGKAIPVWGKIYLKEFFLILLKVSGDKPR